MRARNNLLQVLSPYGNWSHAKGNQVVDENAAELMRKNSERLFSRTIPIYIGHPDENIDRRKCRAVGRVEKIFKTKGGIVISASYADETFKKILNGKITAMSPRWEMEKISNNDFRPIRLVSVGLTNNPNIAGSGKIIDISKNEKISESQNETLFAITSLSKKCANTALKTELALEKIENLKCAISKRRIEKNLTALKIPAQKSSKSDFKRLSARAKEISLATGESYSKVFAKVKNNKI